MHSENIDLLTESLMTPVEFYATEDTRLPYQIYYMFNVDGTNYSVVINQALQKGIYKVSIGAVPSKNLMLWKIKPGHIRTVLSTVIKIIEATIPIIGIKGQAYLIRLPNAVKKNYSNLLEKLVNRSFIKTMKAVHVNNPDKGNKYLFIVRKTANVAELFKTKDFKEYQFGGEDGTPTKTIKDLVQTNGTTVTSIEPEALDIVQDKKIIRKTLSKTPSKSLVVSVKPFLDTASGENIPNIDVEVQDVDKKVTNTVLKGATVTKNPTSYPLNPLESDESATFADTLDLDSPLYKDEKTFQSEINPVILVSREAFGVKEAVNKVAEKLTPIAEMVKNHEYVNVVKHYTGQGYIDVNSFLRHGLQGMVSDHVKTYWEYKYGDSKYTLIDSTSQMMRVLDDLPEIPESMWVFRGTNAPSAPPPWNLEDMVVDPGFLSTSITPEVAQTWGAATVLKIFVPKGAKVIPAFMISQFQHEREIILPPMSVLRPLRVVTKKSSGDKHKQVIECIYIGHGSKWLMNKVTQNIEAAALTEAEEKDKEPGKPFKNKFATDAFDTSILTMVNDMLKKGKIKLEKVPLPRKKKT